MVCRHEKWQACKKLAPRNQEPKRSEKVRSKREQAEVETNEIALESATVKPDELRLLPHCRKPVSHGLKVNFYAERKPKMQYVTIDR